MDKLKMHSPDLTQRNIDAHRRAVPHGRHREPRRRRQPRARGRLRPLRQELSDHVVEGPQERYQLDWPGKRAAAFAANAPIAKTLRPVREESVDFDTTKNLFIEGDNLDALKLLQESYLGKVKLIYIDPPYNTGNDFVYDDDFAESTALSTSTSGQQTATGDRLVANPESNGRFHSDWLNMMYPRLKLARNLLSGPMGAIFVTINDAESGESQALSDEVLRSPEPRRPRFVWIRRRPKTSRHSARSNTSSSSSLYARIDRGFACSERGLDDIDKASTIRQRSSTRSAEEAAILGSAVQRLRRHQRAPKRSMRSRESTGAVCSSWRHFLRRAAAASHSVSPTPELDQRPVSSALAAALPGRTKHSERIVAARRRPALSPTFRSGSLRTRSSKSRQRLLPGWPSGHEAAFATGWAYGAVFHFPNDKSRSSAEHLVEMTTSRGRSDRLDFFAGSGTTAHAVMAANAAIGGTRRFILVQIDEPVDRVSEAARSGTPRSQTLAASESGEPRGELLRTIRRRCIDSMSASARYVSTPPTWPTRAQPPTRSDKGNSRPDRQQSSPTGPTRTCSSRCCSTGGSTVAAPIAVEEVGPRRVLSVADDALIACFADEVTEDVVQAIATRHPLRAVFKDSGFAVDAARINAEQIFREVSPETEVRTI